MNFKQLAKLVLGFEKFLLQAALILIVILFVGQVLLTHEGVRTILSKVDQLEGDKVEINTYQDVMTRDVIAQNTHREPDYYIILEVLSSESGEMALAEGEFLEICINEEPAATIETENESVLLAVNPGDLITIEGHLDKKKPAIISIKDIHDGLLHPHKGYSIYTFGEGEILGWVVAKEN
ncbi:MAG: hypothetical protein GX767_08715 [Firmicutes bacterium]|nr:hypothetical protein [Bacillota bacterium]